MLTTPTYSAKTALIALLLFSVNAFGLTVTFNGDGTPNDNWNVADNWDTDFVPFDNSGNVTTGHNAVIPSAFTVTLDAVVPNHRSTTVSGTLLIEPGAGKASSRNLSLGGGGSVTMNGGSINVRNLTMNPGVSTSFTMNGGTFLSLGRNLNAIILGNGTAASTFTLNGGLAVIGNNADASPRNLISASGTATLNGGEWRSNQGVDSSGVVNLNSGGLMTVNRVSYIMNTGSELNMNGGTLVANAGLENDGTTGRINFTSGTITANRFEYDNPDNTTFDVGAGMVLNLGSSGAGHEIPDGLNILADGILGTGNNAATSAILTTGTLTLESGAIIDFSINGDTKVSDTWALNGGLSLTSFETYNLVVDAVAGSIGLTDGDGGDGFSGEWDIFTWDSNGPTQAVFDDTTWIVSATANTRIGAPGLVDYQDLGGGAGRIFLTNFSAFAIPEPSTAMLLGMGGMVMYFRRRLR